MPPPISTPAPLPTRIVKLVWEVEQRLGSFGSTIAEMILIASKAAAARADSTEDDPASAKGLLSYIYGTRALRKTFRDKAWKRNRVEGIESVVERERNLKLIFQNADEACNEQKEPKAISEKKLGSARFIENSQYPLFPELEEPGEETRPLIGASVYYYFVAVDQEGIITAELSSPRAIEDNQFAGFHERIFVINRGDIDAVILPQEDESTQEFDFTITRK